MNLFEKNNPNTNKENKGLNLINQPNNEETNGISALSLILSKHPEKKVSFCYDISNFLLLLGNYTASGLAISYFDYSLTVILTKLGASYSQLSLISLVVYPNSLKFLIAPFCEAFYFKGWRLGKRKTYIVISLYVTAGVFLASAFFINGWVFEIDTTVLTLVGVVAIVFVALQNIGIDAWSVLILHPDNVTYAALALNLGDDIGLTFAFNIFIWLNLRGGNSISEQISNELMSSQSLFFIISGYILLVGLFTHFCKSETQEYDQKYDSLSVVFRETSGFFRNKELVFLMFVLIFAELGYASVLNCSEIILIQQGFSTDLYDAFDLSSTFVGILGYLICAHYSKKKQEWSLYLCCLLIRFFFDLFLFWIVICYDKNENDSEMTILYGININLYYIVENCEEMAVYSFILRISEANTGIGATFITVLTCLASFGKAWTYTLAVWLLDYCSFTTLTLTTWGFGLVFFGGLGKKIREMEDISDEQWRLS